MLISQPFRGAASRRSSPNVDVIHSETGTLLIDYPPAIRRRLGHNIFDAARDLRAVAPVNFHAPDVEGSRAIGSEKDEAAIGGNRREKIVVRINSQLSLPAAVFAHNPDVPVAAGPRTIDDSVVRRPGDTIAHSADFREYLARAGKVRADLIIPPARRHRDGEGFLCLRRSQRFAVGAQAYTVIIEQVVRNFAR